jgi:UDP-N-acetylglucosamine pyrophosphorylase
VGKCERFLFDLLDYTRSSGALLVQREKNYAPLKNAEGEKSLKTVQEALLRYDQERYFSLTGKRSDVRVFELSPAFYYPSESLKKKLQNHPIQEGEYVDL